MQHRYVGDIGDYLKLSLLKAVLPGHRLGVAWWLFANEAHNSDGRHIDYLSKPSTWRKFDPEVFDHLAIIVAQERNIAGLESASFLAGSRFFPAAVPSRAGDRQAWIHQIIQEFADRDIVFFDPDNGLEPMRFAPGSAKAGKSITVEEIKQFKRVHRTLIVYHHQTRVKGGHISEIASWSSKLSRDFATVDAIRCKPWSPRVYFLLNASDEIRQRCHQLCQRWNGHMQWNPHLESRPS